jgi:maleamate amidohydrolase
MNAKYADVVKTSEVLAFLDTLPSGMYDLPKGNAPTQHESKRAANF